MTYADCLQADALALVAAKMQSSLAVEGELPEEGLSAYGDSADNMMITLAKADYRTDARTHHNGRRD